MKELPNYFGILPSAVRYDKGVSYFAKVLFSEIAALSNLYGYCTASNAFFAEVFDCNPTWVSETIASLEAAGHIKTKVGKANARKIWPLTKFVQKPKRSSGKAEDPSSGKAEHNNTSSNNTSIVSAPAKADADLQPKKADKKDPNEPMNLLQFLEGCRAAKQRHINIIGNYADEKHPDYLTRGQWEQFIRRNLRAARDLSPYTDAQIGKAFKKLKEASKEGGYLSKWTLETIIKYLD